MPRAKNPASNRTDLPGKVPTMEAPNQAYGRRTAEQQSQRILPVSAPAAPTPAPGGQPASTPAAGSAPAAPDLAAILGGGGSSPAGSLKFDHPTERPGVPLTNGLPTGPGPGPEALTGFAGAGAQNLADRGGVKDLLTSLASKPGASSLIKQLAANA